MSYAPEARGRALCGRRVLDRAADGKHRISRRGLTKHLQVLADAGVVRDLKSGRERLWQLKPGQIAEAKRTLEVIGREWEVALGKLKAFVEPR